MRRRLFTLCSAVSLLLAAGVGVLWARSGWPIEVVQAHYNRAPRPDRVYSYFIEGASDAGMLSVVFSRQHYGPAYFRSHSPGMGEMIRGSFPPGARWHVMRQPAALFLTPRFARIGARHDADTRTTGYRYDRWALAVPHWLLIALLLLMPAARLHYHRKARRARRLGLCAACGYDLRASPGRCPECGAAAAKAPEAPGKAA